MKLSPLEFAREFEKMKSDLARQPASDLRLLRLVRFWERLAPVAGKPAYESYVDDFRSLVIGLVQQDALSDLSMDSLKKVRCVLDDLIGLSGADAAPTKLVNAATAVTLRIATHLFCVGAYSEAVSLCAEISGDKMPALPDPDDLRGMSPLDTLREICKSIRSSNETLFQLLRPILTAWEQEGSAVNHDRVWCLFIDKDGAEAAATGRMRLLTGTVEQNVAKSKTSLFSDQVAFNNQVKTPDDPFIGVVYQSLKAVRLGLKSAGFAKRAEGAYRAFLSIERSNRTFTGDSIGLAAALVSFTQLLHPEVMRHDRFIASDIAVTGSITADGEITSVNEATISAKIERAFFSHVRYVVVPESNAATARAALARLHAQHPHRHLRLLPVSHLNDVLDDRNVIRSEKVCIGEYVTKQAIRYTRATKVQVPLLLLLLYAATCLIYPKAWVGFDWNPAYARVNLEGNCLEVFNADEDRLWTDTIQCNVSDSTLKRVCDLDHDGSNEVLWMPQSTEDCSQRGHLICYESDGRKKFRRFCGILGKYRKDTVGVLYTPTWLGLATVANETVIVTQVAQQNPARSHFRFWSAAGDSLGWYINWGHMGPALVKDVDDDGREELVFVGFNNLLYCTALLVLRPDSCYGFSPASMDTACYRGLTPGNHFGYVLFPVTDLGEIDAPTLYNRPGPGWLKVDETGLITVNITEGKEKEVCMDYSIDSRMRVVKAVANDAFYKRRKTLVDSGQLLQMLRRDYQKQYLNAVTYSTDSGWVTEGELRAAETSIH